MTDDLNITNGAGRSANVEFVSAYPNRRLRAEDAYAAFTGDVLSNLLAHSGWSVTREYYVNDAGPQADALARGVFACLTEPAGFLSGHEESETAAIAEALRPTLDRHLLQADENTWLPAIRKAATDTALATIISDLAALNIRHDTFITDAEVAAEARLPTLLKSFAATGALLDANEAPLAQAPARPEARLFLNTLPLADLRNRPLTGAEGRYTYFAYDLAYHQHKIERDYELLFVVFRKDYGSYGPGLAAGVSLLSEHKSALQSCLLDHVIAPPLTELLAYYGAHNLRRLFLQHPSGTPLEISCDANALEQLQAAEANHLAALALPQAPAPEALLAGYSAAVEASLTSKSAVPLLLYTDSLAAALIAAGAASDLACAQLTQCRALLGLHTA
ncbi:hypothetical protein KO498_04185 [Lentibacter algarum]|uniref:hypothetical protein n=1 Tax=Lentibacter algarum TaxID=576131 RepID=UPI001C065AD0|nr:hypothetical protein [Lentibacter algarum]MBU2981007.1 hypothetical protein [Lentibacter algarum]